MKQNWGWLALLGLTLCLLFYGSDNASKRALFAYFAASFDE